MAANEPEWTKKTMDDIYKKTRNSNHKNLQQAQRNAFYKYSSELFDMKVASYLNAFEKMFELKPTPKNVQEVIDAVNLTSHIKNAINTMDEKATAGQDFKLPKVTENNVETMTYLLMKGIKTAIRRGMISFNSEKGSYAYDFKEQTAAEKASAEGTAKNAEMERQRNKPGRALI